MVVHVMLFPHSCEHVSFKCIQNAYVHMISFFHMFFLFALLSSFLSQKLAKLFTTLSKIDQSQSILFSCVSWICLRSFKKK